VKFRLLTALAAFCLCLPVVSVSRSVNLGVATADWPQWRGPERNGISQERGLLKQWPKEGPKLRWQLNDIGDGYSTPAIVGTRLYLMSNRGFEN
jgi:outer membrane protein assembly factor BamB